MKKVPPAVESCIYVLFLVPVSAECAQMLIRAVSFEIPALKQQIKRAQQQVRVCS